MVRKDLHDSSESPVIVFRIAVHSRVSVVTNKSFLSILDAFAQHKHEQKDKDERKKERNKYNNRCSTFPPIACTIYVSKLGLTHTSKKPEDLQPSRAVVCLEPLQPLAMTRVRFKPHHTNIFSLYSLVL